MNSELKTALHRIINTADDRFSKLLTSIDNLLLFLNDRLLVDGIDLKSVEFDKLTKSSLSNVFDKSDCDTIMYDNYFNNVKVHIIPHSFIDEKIYQYFDCCIMCNVYDRLENFIEQRIDEKLFILGEELDFKDGDKILMDDNYMLITSKGREGLEYSSTHHAKLSDLTSMKDLQLLILYVGKLKERVINARDYAHELINEYNSSNGINLKDAYFVNNFDNLLNYTDTQVNDVYKVYRLFNDIRANVKNVLF